MLATVFYFVLLPLASRSAEDLAGLIVLSAQTWVELPPETRDDFEKALATEHGLWLFANEGTVQGRTPPMPYRLLIQQALRNHLGQDVEVRVSDWDEPWYWVEIPIAEQDIKVGFPHSRIGAQPLLAVALVLGGGLILSLLTALLLARRITKPLAKMALAAENLGLGKAPDLLPETGAAEVASLARQFNHMALQVRDLLANRTTLLAGVSHDLRTPLARMRLAIEMLPDQPDGKLIQRLHKDVGQMEQLIASFLDLSRGLAQEPQQAVALDELIGQLIEDAKSSGILVRAAGCDGCNVMAAPLALRRVLSNLLDNALRYGAGQPVDIECLVLADQATEVSVLDRGPGIAEDQRELVFQPFYRIEASRSLSTGGSGLGLSIAQQLAQTNGWSIKLLAREGGGTQAVLEIPKEPAV